MDWEEIYTRLVQDREDAAAWGALAERLRRRAQRDLGHRGWHVVEEVVADTCASVALSFATARGEATFRGFVLGHYLNACHTAFRAGRRSNVSLDGVDVVSADDMHDGVDEVDLVRLRTALVELPARERTAVTLRYVEDMSALEIARVLNTSEVNARQLVFRGLRHLRAALAANVQLSIAIEAT